MVRKVDACQVLDLRREGLISLEGLKSRSAVGRELPQKSLVPPKAPAGSRFSSFTTGQIFESSQAASSTSTVLVFVTGQAWRYGTRHGTGKDMTMSNGVLPF